tara:strand:- start:232 stop:978 length:747 start_codon:yes stop_codon:yes gene_type:complete
MSTAQEKEAAIINTVKRASGVVARLAQRLAGGVTSAYERDKIKRQLSAAKQKQADADAAYRTFQRQSAKSMKSLAAIKASTPTATPKSTPRNTAAALNQGMKKPKPKPTPKPTPRNTAAALNQGMKKPTPKPTPKSPADTSGFAKARAAAAVRAAASKNSKVSPRKPKDKPKPPPKEVNRNTAAALRQGMKDTKGKLKTTLRAARAAGQLFYKDPNTGAKKAAVLKSDLKGQTLREYLNAKQRLKGKT